MLPAIYNPTIKQGVPFRRELIITDDADPPVPVSLGGATAIGQIRTADGSVVLANFSFTITDAEAGKIQWSLADTTVLPPTGGRAQLPYDVFVVPLGGDRICPVEGLIEVEAARTTLTP